MKEFLKGVFSESDKTPSSSRIFTALTVAASLVWISYIVYRTHELPEGSRLAALAAFSTAHYAANRAGAAISALGK